MDAKRYFKIINNPRHIPGVHNYCDRWCERCPLTLRCSVYATESIVDPSAARDPTTRDAQSLWPRLDSLQPLAQQLLTTHADHPGLPLKPHRTFKSIVRNTPHPLTAAASRYMEFAHVFVKEQHETFPVRLPCADISITPAEAFEIINFYHTLMPVKLARAVHRDDLDDEFEALEPDAPNDHDGSAKIALITLDRSLLAWVAVTLIAPDFTPNTLSAILTLHRLRNNIEKEFPKAQSFHRTGFDDLTFPLHK